MSRADEIAGATEAARELVYAKHYTLGERGPKLTEAGERAREQAFGGPLTDSQRADIEQALRARWQIKDKHYLVENSQILVYDELTGSVQPGRRFNGELHAFVEAKEGLTIHATQRAVDMRYCCQQHRLREHRARRTAKHG